MSNDTLGTVRQALRAARILTHAAHSRYDLATALGISDRQALRIAQMLVEVGVATSEREAGKTVYRVPKGLKFSEVSA